MIDSSTKLNETLIPIRVVSAKITEWRAGFIPQKTELTAFCQDKDGDISLPSIACGSCTIPPIHRTEQIHHGNGEYSYCIDAGHEFCGSSACMNPMFTLVEQFSKSIDLEKDTLTVFFLSNGWVNLHPSWGSHNEVKFQGTDNQLIKAQLFNVSVDLVTAIQQWKRNTWTGWALGFLQSNYLLYNLAGIGAIPTQMLKSVADDVAESSPVFQTMVNYLKK